jgi:archaellum component FlaF (FlaF/FlaG flagellin family)
MKKPFLLIALLFTLQVFAQSPTGYWYGAANVKLRNTYSNYLVELILVQDNNNVKGVLNYFFKNTYRSIPIRGTYNSTTRLVYISNIPVSYYGSYYNRDVDCAMNFAATLRVSQLNSVLKGSFISKPEYKYTCPEILFTLNLNTDSLKQDSVMNAIKAFKETFQVWRPSEADTIAAVRIQPRNVVNYVVSNQYKEREKVVAQELTVEADSIKVDFYDNGEIDGDSISVFLNDKLIAFNRVLTTRSVHFDIPLDTTREFNEITMFADNLGSIPPNTALMIVNDGNKRHEIRLTSNLEKNATIRIKKKKPGNKTNQSSRK